MKNTKRWLMTCLLLVSMAVFISTSVQAAGPDVSYVFGPDSPNWAVHLQWPDGGPLSVALRVHNAKPSYVPGSISAGAGASYAITPWKSNPRTLTFSHPDHADDIVVQWSYDPNHVESPPDVSHVFGPGSPYQTVYLQWPDGGPLSAILRVYNAKPSYVPGSISAGAGAGYAITPWESNPRTLIFSHPDHAADIVVQWSYDPDHVDPVTPPSEEDTAATLARISQDFVGGATTVEEFVHALPAHHKSRALFMVESQAGDADFVSPSTPRVISWGATADDMFSWGTNDESPRYDQVEFITKEEGQWAFGVIDFASSPPTLSIKTEECHTCHVHGHPIWGVNYKWPGTVFDFYAEGLIDAHPSDWIGDLKSSGDPRVTPVWTDPKYGVSASTKPLEMEEAVVTRHAEVLAESLLPEEDAIDYAEALLCPSGSDTTLRDVEKTLEVFFPVAHWPHAMGDDDGTVRDVAKYRPLKVQNLFPESNANLYATMAFYLVWYLVEHDDGLTELYEGLANEETVNPENPEKPGYHQRYLHYPPGTATALDELDSRSDIFFDLKGFANIHYRVNLMSTMTGNRRHQVVVREGHLEVMVPKICGVLYPEE